jgi:hypothetical protein
MPVTPFHFGPALLVKAALRGRFSLGVFALVQAVIDTESVVNLARDAWPIHSFLHTLPGSLAVAVACAAAGRPLCSRLNLYLTRPHEKALALPAWVTSELRGVTWTGALVGASFGALSHVALDATMHPDMSPFWPWTADNPLLRADPLLAIHLGCTIAGLLGLAAWAALAR